MMSSAKTSVPCEIPISIWSGHMTKAKKAQMPDAFWQWFDGIRLERNLNDAGMARLTGVDQSTISKAR